MTKTFKIPFATQGDRTSIPNEVQADGAVSYTQGYGYDYERDQLTDPAAKDIEREKMNSVLHDITEAIGEMQAFGLPKWNEEGKPYSLRTIVYHKNKAWQSKVENNNVEPITGAAWAELKADLSATEVGAYNKDESDKRFQPVGNYQAAGYSYSKAESDTHFQPKGNYAPAANYALKGESYTKVEGDDRYQAKGSYQPAGDYATNAALTNGLNSKINTADILQATGGATNKTMSQKAISDALQNAVNINTIYPVGIVTWFAQNKNPNTLFPGTKWNYIGENKTIRLANSSGNNVLSSGGSDSISLAVANLPAHNHSFSANTSSFDYGTKTTNTTGNHQHSVRTETVNKNVAGITNAGWTKNTAGDNPAGMTTSSNGNHAHTIAIGAHSHSISGTTSNAGSGSAVSVINAYITLMGWYRVS